MSFESIHPMYSSEPRFHIGVAGPVRRAAPRRRVITPIRNSALESLRVYPPFTLTRPQKWLILPSNSVPENIQRFFQFIPYGYKATYDALQDTGVNPFSKGRVCFRIPNGMKLAPLPYYTKEFTETLRKVIQENQILRWRFKRLVQNWRIAKLRQANTTDVVTMEIPKNPVYIVDWPTRTRYTFEATTLFRGIRTSLLLAEELFPTPQSPKNPYTNQPLSFAQLHFALNTLRSKGLTDWATESFRVVSYDVKTFKRRNNTQMRLSALKSLFANPAEVAYVDLLYDFIDFAHDNAGIEMERKDVWEWAIQKKHDHPRIQSWRACCYSYYMNLIATPMDESVSAKMAIMAKTEELVKLSMTDLIYAWRNRI